VSGFLRTRLAESLQAFADVFRNRNLRRLELAWLGSSTGEWAAIVALSVFAFESGGAAAVGLVVLIRMLPAAVAAPFSALLADRFSRTRVMVAADLIRALAVAGAAVAVFADAPAGVVYALAGLVAVVSTAFRPAQASLLPNLARRPQELTAANVASSTIESVAFFAGPALGGLLLAATSVGVVFAAQAVAFLWSALLVHQIVVEPVLATEAAAREQRGIGRELAAGFEAVARDNRLRVLIGLFGAQTLVGGALNVLVVATALELLDVGEAGLGLLASADGLGGLLGAAGALLLVGRHRLAATFGAGILLWGVPLALIGVWPEYVVAFAMLVIVGVANTIVDVAGLTLLQRGVDDSVLARVFGVLETLVLAAIALGGVLAAVLISWLGIRGALVATGAFLPALALLTWRRLAAIDAAAEVPSDRVALLRSGPIFAPLPPPTIEHLAISLDPVTLAPGMQIIRQGEPGDRFYVVAKGELAVSMDGREMTTLGAGAYFGEIALLRDVPRTATVRARTQALVYALDRDEFIAAVTGHAESADAADAVIATRLSRFRPEVASF
jgi:Cyclic nucleotide-binding domain/Major Facilitator Superfamily